MATQENFPNNKDSDILALNAKEKKRLQSAIGSARREGELSLNQRLSSRTAEITHVLGAAALLYPVLGINGILVAGSMSVPSWLYGKERRATIHTPDKHYGMQIFSVSTDTGEREAHLLVLPRTYEDDKKESDATRYMRLQQAAETIDEIAPDKVVVPDELLSPWRQGSVQLADKLYPHLENEYVDSPFPEEAMGRVFTPESFKTFVDSLDGHEEWGEIWGYMQGVLEKRFPLLNTSHQSPETLRKIMSLMQRQVQNLPGVTTQSVTDEMGRRLPGRRKEYFMNTMRLDPNGNTIIEGKDASGVVIESRSLASEVQKIIKAPEEAWSADDLAILDAAHLSLARTLSTLPQSAASQPETSGEGRKSRAIELNYRKNYGKYLKHMIGRLAVGAAISVSVSYLTAHGGEIVSHHATAEPSHEHSGAIGASDSDAPLWKMETKGLSSEGYYARNIYYDLQTNGWKWDGALEKQQDVSYPTDLKDPAIPHITLSHVAASEREVSLPIRENTSIAAVRVTGKAGATPEFSIKHSTDGMYMLYLANGTPAKISYDLVETSGRSWGASSSLSIDGTPESLSLDAMQLQNKALFEGASPYDIKDYIASHYTYTNKASQLPQLGAVHDPSSFVDKLNKEKKANCTYAGTQFLTLIAALDSSQQSAGYATGYYASSKDGYLYQGHAFPVLDWNVVDPTPPAPQGVDVGLKEKTPAELDKEWSNEKRRPLEGEPSDLPYKLLLGTLAAAGAYGIYRGSRKVQPFYHGKVVYHQKKSAGIDAPAAAQFMGWLEYGRYGGKIGGGTPPSMASIHDETLRDVAKGAFPDGPLTPEENVALRHMAKLTLARRAHGR